MPAFAFDSFAHRNMVKRAVSGACQLYKSPKTGATLNSSTPITFEWDPSCLGDANHIDIALLSARGVLFRWGSVPAATGKHDCQLDAGWWDQQNSVQLQLGITASGEPLALSPFPAGPIFTARNSNPIPTVSTSSLSGSGTRSSSSPAPTGNYAGAGGVVDVQQLYSNLQSQHQGRLATSIILPLLVAALLFIGGYIWYSRRREAKRRQQWVETVDKRMSRVSADWQSMSALGGRPSMQSGTNANANGVRSSLATGENGRPSIYDRFKSSTSDVNNEKNVFAAEDVTQLGPRARALSAAAAEGRPLSELYRDLPAMPSPSATTTGLTRARSKSMAQDGTLPRPMYNRASASHTRTTSTTSNNPYASAMVQRDSQALDDRALYAFPVTTTGGNGYSSNSPVQRTRLDSSNSGPTPRARLDSANGRGRVTSRVSFADVPPRLTERKWNHADGAEKPPVLGRVSVADSFAVDFDSLPALALMRVQSGDGLEETKSPFTPTREFIPGSKEDYSSARQATSGTGISGRTPDEMLKAYAAAMAGEKGEFGQEMEMGSARGQGRRQQQQQQQEEESGGMFSSVRKLWRK